MWITSPDLLNDLYLVKNKHFDKHIDVKRLSEPLLGNSLLFVEKSEMWNMHRKAMSASLYKDKLIKYTGIINQNVTKVIKEIEGRFVDTGVEMDLIAEVQGVFTRIILDSAFGEDFETQLFDYVKNGKIVKVPMGRYLFQSFNALANRFVGLQVLLLPESIEWYLTKKDREIYQNA